MNNYIKSTLALSLAALALTGCNDYLDVMPDNRATLDNEEKLKSILVSAYPTKEYAWVNELSSDNCDDFGVNNPNTNRWMDDTFAWKEETEDTNESMNDYWESSYVSIAAANEALAGIANLGNDVSATIQEIKGEALMARAYNHFILANLFCQAWTQNAASELGLPYMDHPETELLPKYERGNLAEFYEKIQKDIEEGIDLVGDSYYTVPKYHFTKKAAYAFACRFYLYTEQWEKAVDMANKCLGSDPTALLRDWDAILALPYSGGSDQYRMNEYVSTTSNSNLLLTTAYSSLGLVFGGYSLYSRYNHGQYLATQEDYRAANLFGTLKRVYGTYTGTNMDKSVMCNTPYMFEYTDPVAGIGYRHTVIPVLTTDECLLNRAEALIMLRRYDEAAADLTKWGSNIATTNNTLTPESIQTFYNGKTYCYDDADGIESGMKKHLNPAFTIDAEGSVQESMLQCVLAYRRIETLHHGIRWFDIKRYGIEIPRRVMGSDSYPASKTDVLLKNDLRRAYQIPLKVRDAGLEANPR